VKPSRVGEVFDGEFQNNMTLTSLQAVTWGTVTGAVLSALLLGAGETGLPDLSRLRRGDAAQRPSLPSDPTNATGQRQARPTAGVGLTSERHDMSVR
jgi:hypothetical protein